MTPYVEQLRRSQKRVQLIEGSFQIFRILLSNDQADRGGLTSILAPGSGVVLSGIFHAFPSQFFGPTHPRVSSAHCVSPTFQARTLTAPKRDFLFPGVVLLPTQEQSNCEIACVGYDTCFGRGY